VTTTAAAAGIRRHSGTYPAEPGQVRHARAALARWLEGCPQADEAILIASEFASNSVLHSASRDGGAFTLRAEVRPDGLRIEVEDAGGAWRDGPGHDDRPHGLDVVAAIVGSGNWGIEGDAGGRIAWARLGRVRDA
jgi:serine/threonine-protein kinase RsbW